MKLSLPKNTANVISLIRIFLSFFLWYLIFIKMTMNFFWLSIVVYFTDVLDGFIARTFKLESELGRNLDTFGDILFFPTMIVGTIFFFKEFFAANILILIILGFAKTFGYLTVFIRMRRLPTAHLRTAQTWGYWLMLFVITAFLNKPQLWIMYVMIVHSFVFSLEYILFCSIIKKPEHENLHSYYALKKELEKENNK